VHSFINRRHSLVDLSAGALACARAEFGGLRSVTGLEWFAFVILPAGVVALGGLACGMALRLRLEEERPGQKILSGRAGRAGW
jgi:hypothetical protein